MLALLQTEASMAEAWATGELDPDKLVAAKDMTKEEFRDNWFSMLRVLSQRLDDMGETLHSWKPVFSYDHNRVQDYADLNFNAAELQARGVAWHLGTALVVEKHRMPLPRDSPDCHRVIEHCFGQISTKLHKQVFRDPDQFTDAQAVLAKVLELFVSITPDSIRRDATKLPKLWRWVADNHGQWGPRKMR